MEQIFNIDTTAIEIAAVVLVSVVMMVTSIKRNRDLKRNLALKHAEVEKKFQIFQC